MWVPMIRVPADLFELANVGEPWPQKLAHARRLLVSAWLVQGNEPKTMPDIMPRARAVWDCNVNALARSGRVTVVTTLLQLQELGFVRSFDAVEGGFAVELVKEGT